MVNTSSRVLSDAKRFEIYSDLKEAYNGEKVKHG